ncbi:MAG TPA: DUF2306 domain-containing protein [Polyangiaceae bacterium]|nr:DUF2306 domain-containing protein [Polyangiaceae bacterium]
MKKLTKQDFLTPALLLALSLVPTLGGIARLASLSGSAPADARFLQAPLPIVLHVVSATLYSLLGAFQFSSGVRSRWPGWHRRAGRWLALSGLLAGATGFWMTACYPIPTSLQGPLLYGVRLAVSSAMVASLLIAWRSILHRDVPRHEAFMIRAYALGQGAGTQVLVLLPWMLLSGESGGLTRDVLMTLSWLLNLLVAEAIVRSRAARRTPRSERQRRSGLVTTAPRAAPAVAP